MKAAIYSRFSTDRQTDSSIADQVRVCTEYAAANAMTIVASHDDQGISGAALGNRPGVLKLQEAALVRRFDVLLVTDLSRLSRSQGDLSKMIDRLVAKGIRVVGVQDGYDSARRGHKLQAGLSGIMGEAFREMVKDRTYAALESRAKEKRSTGGRAYGYIAASKSASGKQEVNAEEAAVVREIFERFVAGASWRTIAAELNGCGVPSPGSAWSRNTRRCGGWMGSGLRVLLRNPIYSGRVNWNTSEWRKDPDSGKRSRHSRPESEWITRQDESLRIVPDGLWIAAQKRTRSGDNERMKSGGKPRFLLSGLLRCKACGAHYIIANSKSYACSGYIDGRACSNGVHVRRDHIQSVLLDPIRNDLLAPVRVQRMQREMETYFSERMAAIRQRAVEQPKEIQEIGARIERLRARLQTGDPDLAPDELQAALERAEGKRDELMAQQPSARRTAKIFEALPRAAELYGRQITAGLDGNAREALKARTFLRELFEGGRIDLVAEPDGSLFAEFGLQKVALLRAIGTYGSGGRI